MRIFVTGAAGFIGSQVVRRLAADGHAISALVRPGSSRWRLEAPPLPTTVTIVDGDLADLAPLERSLRNWKPEACVHLAWYAVPGKYLEARENIECLNQSLELIERLNAAGCRHVVIAGTCAEYDTDAGYLRESSPTRPATLYAASKLALASVGAARAAQLEMTFAWARLFYLYGPYEDERRMVPSLIRALVDKKQFPASSGRQIRDYLHVEDVAAALGRLTTARATGVFNVSSGLPVAVRDLMETVGRLTGQPDLIRFGALPDREWEPPFICGDPGRLRATGWAPAHDLEAGLRQTRDWWASRQRT